MLNDALINWFDPRDNYDAVVTQAADEAGGQGLCHDRADQQRWTDRVATEWSRPTTVLLAIGFALVQLPTTSTMPAGCSGTY